MPKRAPLAIALSLILLFTASIAGAQSWTVSYQGELKTNGQLFTGVANFKFAVVASSGATIWSNDNTSSTGDEPVSSTPLEVDHGIFSVRLGDPSLGQSPIPADGLALESQPVLRIWVDTGSGFEQLGDASISGTPYARVSEVATRAEGDFEVPQTLTAGTVATSAFALQNGASAGYVLTSDALGNASWQPVPSGGSDGDWTVVGNDMYANPSGLVGIGTTSPTARLDVNGIERVQELWADPGDGSGPRTFISGSGTLGGLVYVRHANRSFDGVELIGGIEGVGGTIYVNDRAGVSNVKLLGDENYGGRVAIGNGAGDTGFLDGNVGGGAQIRLTNSNWNTTFTVTGQAYSSGSQTRMYDSAGTLRHEWTAGNSEWKSFDSSGGLKIQSSGAGAGGTTTYYQTSGQNGVRVDGDYANLGGRIHIYDSSGTESATILGEDSYGGSRVIAGTFEVNSGSDLSESFDINGSAKIEPGMVVCIDPDEIGKLVESREPYQHTVAGIVSGAGGIKPGMLMGQQGSVADGKHPVALTGRVWTWCDAGSAPIEPGDLLTTSATPGHAMKVTDHERSNGAILGKAMSGLRSGRGMVLVLVSLQ